MLIKFLRSFCLLLVFVVSPLVVWAQEEDNWRYELSPYLFLPNVDADSTIDGDTVPLDLDIGDIFDLVKIAFATRFEARQGDLSLFIDGGYVRLDEDFSPGAPQLDLDIRDFILDFGATYKLIGNASAGIHDNYVSLLGGLRYHYLKQEVDVAITTPITGGAMKLGTSHDWVEPFIGVEGGVMIANDVALGGRAHFGGFGMGSASDLAITVEGGFDWRFTESWSTKVGYRFQHIDYTRGGGDDEFGFDGELHGPYLAATYYFGA